VEIKMIKLDVIKNVVTSAAKSPKILVGVGFASGIFSSVMIYKTVTNMKSAIEEGLNQYVEDLAGDMRKSRNYNGYSSYTRKPNYENMVFATKKDAEETLMGLNQLIFDYGYASIADFSELMGISANFTDNLYGWDDLSKAFVLKVRNGYRIYLPKTINLDIANVNKEKSNKENGGK
jgi:hypothetical protein